MSCFATPRGGHRWREPGGTGSKSTSPGSGRRRRTSGCTSGCSGGPVGLAMPEILLPRGFEHMASQAQVTLTRRARNRLRTRVCEIPGLYLPFARRKYPGPSPEVISSETQFVIDGYTRSASTFAVYALQLSQDKPVRLAHHLHAPAQLIRAARRGVPALVLIREPQGAVLSQLIREPGVALPDALVAYARFYTCLLPYYDKFVVADFEEVTSDFGSVIRRVNKQFGTTFAEFKPTQANIS